MGLGDDFVCRRMEKKRHKKTGGGFIFVPLFMIYLRNYACGYMI